MKVTAKDIFFIIIISSLTIGLIFAISNLSETKLHLDIALKEHKNDLRLLLQIQPDNYLFQKDLNNTSGQINDLEHSKTSTTLLGLFFLFGIVCLISYCAFPLLPKNKEGEKK